VHKRVLMYLAPGFEEIETVTVIDLLRRAEIDVTVASLTEGVVTGAHGIRLTGDVYYKKIKPEDFEVLVLPGGQPGTENLKKDPQVLETVRSFNKAGKQIAAICAAPTVLAEAGILRDKRITSYPSEKLVFTDSVYLDDLVVKDGNLLTSRGVGTAIDFALDLIAWIRGEKLKEDISKIILWS